SRVESVEAADEPHAQRRLGGSLALPKSRGRRRISRRADHSTDDQEGPDDIMTETESWDIFVLASCARLGPFPGVHLAPKLSAQALGVAIRAHLPFAPGEFLAAIVENESGGFPCPVLLSNRRMYWFLRTDAQPGSDGKTPT